MLDLDVRRWILYFELNQTINNFDTLSSPALPATSTSAFSPLHVPVIDTELNEGKQSRVFAPGFFNDFVIPALYVHSPWDQPSL